MTRSYRGQKPRQLTDKDIESWDRQHMDRPPRTTEQIRAHIRAGNPVRWWRLQRDLKWIQREMRKLGLNPDDARWIL